MLKSGSAVDLNPTRGEELSAFRLPSGRPKQTKFEWSARQGNEQDSSLPTFISLWPLGQLVATLQLVSAAPGFESHF